MKYKDAVKLLFEIGNAKLFDIETLYKKEMLERIELRSHGLKTISQSLVLSVIKEMDNWIFKVCQGLAWSDDACYKSKQECHDSAMTSMHLAIAIKKRQGEEPKPPEPTDAGKLLRTYALLGTTFKDIIK